jgi:HD-GYP domain-containing protein (c-di-GMP phosphodiesterase class II)
MTVSIFLLGEVALSDRRLLSKVAADCDANIRLAEEAEIVSKAVPDDSLADGYRWSQGCISFLPCEKQSIIRLFSTMPIGSGQEIPFFQKIDAEEPPDFLKQMPVCGVFYCPLTETSAWNMVAAIVRYAMLAANSRELISEIARDRAQKLHLINIGAALSSHNNLEALLSLILSESRDLVGADAGSIYIREKSAPGGSFGNALRFKISQNDSVDVRQASEFAIPMDRETIAGYVASTGDLLNIDDVYFLPAGVPYRFGREWDKKLGYRMKSMLTIPMKNMAGEVVGVLQLMNKKKDKAPRLSSPSEVETWVVSFSGSDENFLCSIGSQAAVSIERAQLYREIELIFEGYLKSSVAAIDERDKITYGHSHRVMGYAMAFADAVNVACEGPFKDIVFSDARRNQFRFAALLHDIGKIGVPEALLMKETRLSKEEMEAIGARVDYIRLSMQSNHGEKPSWHSTDALKEDWAFLQKVNTTGFLNDDDFTRLTNLRDQFYFGFDKKKLPFLSSHEWESLSVRRGNLTSAERQRINSHAVSTLRILSRVPWTRDLEGIPEIASHHHERIDGSGYPDGLVGEEIRFESKALAVIDIFEALVAQDRPYKPKMAPEKAIAVLRSEVEAKHLEPDIVEFFIEKGIYKLFENDTDIHEIEA